MALIPDAAQLGEPHLQAVNQRVAEACAAAGVAFVDLTEVFEAQNDSESLYLFPIDAHTSPKGNRLIAETLAACIVKKHLLGPEAERPRAEGKKTALSETD